MKHKGGSCESKYPGESVYAVSEENECPVFTHHVVRNGIKDESCC